MSLLSLFEYCTRVILHSPYLLERASFHLPRGISCFLLYLALETRNQLAVRKLVEKWPHSHLTLDLLSSPLCRRHRSTMPHCLEPHEYMGVFGSYARYSCYETVSSLLEGVFYNLYLYSGMTGGSVGLRSFDISYVIVDVCQVPLLLNLVKGRVPVTHLCDYVSDREAKILGVSRPQLKSCDPQQLPLTLYVNLMLDETTSKQTVATLAEICSQSQWVQVVYKGINILGLSYETMKKLRLNLGALLSSVTDHMYLTDVCFRELTEIENVTTALHSFSLWVSCDITLPLKLPTIPSNCTGFLLATRENSHRLATKLSDLSLERRTLQALCLLLWRQRIEMSDGLCGALGSLLLSVSSSLEYLQLRCWSLISTDLESLLQCSKLRVLSVTEECVKSHFNRPRHSASEIFTAISQLPHLEFFQWSESINLTTAALLSLHHLLCDSVRSLQHFHVSLIHLLLSTMDLENKSYSPLIDVLLPLLRGKEGNESCTTYIFPFENDIVLQWLSVLRPEVCFRLGNQVECVSELHRAATVYDHLYY